VNLPPAPKRTNPPRITAHGPDWSALRLFNQYRLILLLALAAIYYLAEDQRTLGSRDGLLFEVLHLGYLVTTLGFIYLIRCQRPSVTTQFFIQNYLDILFIGGLMYASGGVESGLGPLLLINLALLSQLARVRHALLFAAISSMIVISEELLARLIEGPEGNNFEASAALGALLFATAWIMSVPVRKLMNRQLANSSRSRVVLDVEELAQLNEKIITELHSGVIVIDAHNNVQLINETARTLLAAEFIPMPVNLKKKLDDHAQITNQYQQLKLASLGKLSASIAHEIKNPLGAISNAVQIVQKSDSISEKDAELLSIANQHTQRINKIIADILQLSNRRQIRHEIVAVDNVIQDFAKRFREEHQLDGSQLVVSTEQSLAFVDPIHLDQVLWNLCTNAQNHNTLDKLKMVVHCWKPANGTTAIDVTNNGKGISDIEAETLFDPFYAAHHAEIDLGLYVIRELCDLNNATIECLPSAKGAHFRVTLNSTQDMAA